MKAFAQTAAPAPMSAATPGQLPHDVRTILPYRMTLMDYLPWLAAGVALVVLAALLFYYWRKRRAIPAPEIPADPWDVLFANLRNVTMARPFAGAAQIEYYFQLSLLLREAIERRTTLRATDLTLGELRAPLRKKLPLAPDAIEAVLVFLERSDLVKFAGYESTPEEAQAAKDQVLTWARSLRPVTVDDTVTAQMEQRGAAP